MRVFYSDGSYKQSMDGGGWAYLEVVDKEIISEKWGADYSFDLTSNQMEMKAVIETLKVINQGESATILSDCQYVVKGISEWINGWIKNNWITSKDEAVLNKDLWLEILELTKNKNINWVWVRSHDKNQYNNRVDELAKLTYIDPEELMPKRLEEEGIIKPDVGNIIYFDDPSKRYIVMLNDITLDNNAGFLARMLANNLGTENEFFHYSKTINIIEQKTDKESRMVFKAVEQFKEKVSQSFSDMKNSCKHNIKKSGDSACCSLCDRYFGWYCPDSKDKCCHYFSENGKVELITGEIVNVPKSHDQYHEDYDWCIFCGDPEERK
jgi:ribonuclease HI